MSMTYDQLNTYLQTILEDQAPSADYTTILPAAIQDAEQRIYRDMDFLATRTVDSNSAFTQGTRDFTLPTATATILVLQGVSAISPAGVSAAAGTRCPLEPVSLDFIDITWPVESMLGLPDSWAMKNATVITIKPTPDAAYKVELTGTFRPAALSSANQTSYITLIYPDLMVAACMVFMTGYQRDFGAQASDPAMAVSWEATYQSRLKSALAEEQRRKGSSTGWSPFSETLAIPART